MAYHVIVHVEYEGNGRVLDYCRESDSFDLPPDEAEKWAQECCFEAERELLRRRPGIEAAFSYTLEDWS